MEAGRVTSGPVDDRGLADRLGGLAAELGETEATGTGEVVTYGRSGREFAVVAVTALEFRLPADIAEAALRTPGTSASPRGPGWVQLVGNKADGTVADRAEAWFKAAWRAAGQ